MLLYNRVVDDSYLVIDRFDRYLTACLFTNPNLSEVCLKGGREESAICLLDNNFTT